MDIQPGGIPPLEAPKKQQWWMWVVIALVFLFFLFGIYFFGSRNESYIPPVVLNKENMKPNHDITTEMLTNQSSSDDLAAIAADVQASDFTSLDKELTDIQTQIP